MTRPQLRCATSDSSTGVETSDALASLLGTRQRPPRLLYLRIASSSTLGDAGAAPLFNLASGLFVFFRQFAF